MSARKRIGVIVPSTNTTCEGDFQMVVPEGTTVHGQRMWLTNDAAGEAGMESMNAEIDTGARYLATARVDVVAYGCTTGSFFKGPGWDREMIDVMQRNAGAPAVATSPSVVEALQHFGARRISIATPYAEWNNVKLRSYVEALGFEVLNLEAEPAAARSGNQGINEQDPEVIAEFATRICRPDADALLCSCTAWRSVEAVAEIERRTGKPVVTSNQALIWAALRVLGIATPIAGFGQLLSDPGATRAPA
ncbi:MAG: maleate cis-trans isomerase family protein [Gammaproteobacteria bacterium]